VSAHRPAAAPVSGGPGWGRPRRRTVDWWDPAPVAEAAEGLSGLEFLRAVRDGLLPPPPMASLFGLRIVAVERGSVVFECEPDESTYNPIGTVHGGLVCTLADTVSACAVHTTLEAGVGYTSIDLDVRYLRPVTAASGVLSATGSVTRPGRRVAFATATITDAAGRSVATATTSCLIMGRTGP